MAKALNGFVKAYLDDVVIFSSSWEDHLRDVHVVLSRLREAGLTLKVQKCQFARSPCTYLGYVIGGGLVKPEGSKILASEKYPVPETSEIVSGVIWILYKIYSELCYYCIPTYRADEEGKSRTDQMDGGMFKSV